MYDLMGLAACITNETFDKETIVIGMMLMPGPHCAENIQMAVENLVNKYDFDKTKIIGEFLDYFFHKLYSFLRTVNFSRYIF